MSSRGSWRIHWRFFNALLRLPYFERSVSWDFYIYLFVFLMEITLLRSHLGLSRSQNPPRRSTPAGISWTAKGMSHCLWDGAKVVETP